jgi:hypothetical protein
MSKYKRRGEIVNASGLLALIITIAAPAAARAQTTAPAAPELQRRYEGMTILEGTLIGAVRSAATQVATKVRSNTNARLFTGDARAKGFVLDGYGVFVHVEIPALDMTMLLAVDQLEREEQRRGDAGPGGVNNKPDPPVGTAKDALRNLADEDPGQKYRDAVKLSLIDAMLDYSKNLELKPDEWLSVAARGSESGLLPGEVFQLTTVVLRVKGSDLTDYLAGRLTRDEARKKVEARQF